MHRPDWRVEPQPQQVTTRGFRRVAVVESGPRMQDRVVVDEIRFARLSDKDLALIADLLSLDSVNCESTTGAAANWILSAAGGGYSKPKIVRKAPMDITAWLHGLGLERYEAAFRDNEIDWEVLPKLTADDLKDIGVTAVGHRRKLLEAIAKLSAADAAPDPIPPTAPTGGSPLPTPETPSQSGHPGLPRIPETEGPGPRQNGGS
jgi:hypothetical protein